MCASLAAARFICAGARQSVLTLARVRSQLEQERKRAEEEVPLYTSVCSALSSLLFVCTVHCSACMQTDSHCRCVGRLCARRSVRTLRHAALCSMAVRSVEWVGVMMCGAVRRCALLRSGWHARRRKSVGANSNGSALPRWVHYARARPSRSSANAAEERQAGSRQADRHRQRYMLTAILTEKNGRFPAGACAETRGGAAAGGAAVRWLMRRLLLMLQPAIPLICAPLVRHMSRALRLAHAR